MMHEAAQWLVLGGALLLVFSVCGALSEKLLFRDDEPEPSLWDTYPDGVPGEPTDDDIYNRAVYEPDVRDEHDWSL